ncbi:hypothetical protein [Streptomyces californicus]|uniref:hypothetical protein n=1 Tax=Streptomyces californicus TaxID=67351 RepID=UPI0035E00911
MSARDELLESLLPWTRRPADGEEDACNALIDAFAHELAEKVRAEERNRKGWAGSSFGLRLAADLIDPEVETS